MYIIAPMDPQNAALASAWQYPEPYQVYSAADYKETVAELLNGDYHAALLAGELAGYYCFGASAQVPAAYQLGLYPPGWLDYGLGLRPDITGKGQGLTFVQAGISYSRQLFPSQPLRLTVAAFNQRAILVYERAGFAPESKFATADGTDFIIMTHHSC